MVLALLRGDKAYIANRGDSRAYILRSGTFEVLTKDYNVASVLVDMGKITTEEARTHPMRHQLTVYVGMSDTAMPEVKNISLEHGARLRLCTDGLTGMIPENEIADILANEEDCIKAIGSLISKANEAGGYDNITVVIVDIR